MVEIGSAPHDKDWVGQMMALQREIRGGILDAAIQVERALDLVLANHFCERQNERWWQLYSLVLAPGTVSFRRKADLVLDVLKASHPDLLEQHSGLKAALTRVIAQRNAVAHLESGVSAGFETRVPPDHINLIRYKNGKRQTERLTRAKAARQQQEALRLFRELAEIAEAVRRRK